MTGERFIQLVSEYEGKRTDEYTRYVNRHRPPTDEEIAAVEASEDKSGASGMKYVKKQIALYDKRPHLERLSKNLERLKSCYVQALSGLSEDITDTEFALKLNELAPKIAACAVKVLFADASDANAQIEFVSLRKQLQRGFPGDNLRAFDMKLLAFKNAIIDEVRVITGLRIVNMRGAE